MYARVSVSRMLAALQLGVAAGLVPLSSTEVRAEVGASVAIEEVVVTAQRRAERFEEVPVSVTVLPEARLEQVGLIATTDLERLVPGLELTFNGGFLQPAIRGITSQGSDAGDSSNVAVYLDGVYQPSQIGQLMDLPDVTQIQVLKGPQGTLYGQNATGGAILVTTVEPELTEARGRLVVGGGSFDERSVRGFWTGPLAEDWAATFALLRAEREGFRRDRVRGGRDAGLSSLLLRGKLRHEPWDGASLLLTAHLSDRRDSAPYAGTPWRGRSVGYVLAELGGLSVDPPAWKESDTSRPVDTHAESKGISLKGIEETRFGTIEYLASHSRQRHHLEVDVDYSFFHHSDVTVHLEQEYLVQELNFLGDQRGAWRLAGGLFRLDGLDRFAPNTFRVALQPGPAPLFDERLATLAPVSFTWGEMKREIVAAWTEVSYEFSPRLTGTIGGRYSDEKQRVAANFRDRLSAVQEASPWNPATFTEFTPRVTLRFAAGDRHNFYLSYAEGFKSGILSVAAPEAPPVDPERVWAVEGGYKGKPFDSLNLAVAVFHYDYRDLQVARWVAPDYLYQNAARASAVGADLDLSWQATERLELSAGIAWLDAEYDEFPEAGAYRWDPQAWLGSPTFPFSPAGPNVGFNYDASGNRLIRAPRLTATFSTTWQIVDRLGIWEIYGNAYYNSGYDLEVTGEVHQPAYWQLDARIQWQPPGAEGVRLACWVRNLSDERVLQSLLETSFASGVSFAPPRTLGIEVEFVF
ncbi:MAG: TonB-dependent receptor [Porticoccaceae bacterium]|nr:MAG: TonB-dependent receptor [Porticoccaceae bacterium]